MDRDWTDEVDRAESSGSIRSEMPVLPSRRPALEALRAAIAAGRGPALLTGEAGSGKTWLVARLIAESDGPRSPRWVSVDVAPTTAPADLLRGIAIGLGLDTASDASADAVRQVVALTLAERAAEGRRWALVVDEAHLAGVELLEEVRILSNRLGRADGFASLVLIGQTSLARRLATRPLAGLDSRLSARVTLGPIDADEAAALLAQPGEGPSSVRSAEEVERLHRDAIGNPGRLLRLHAATAIPRPHRRPEPTPVVIPATSTGIVPTKPPLRVEDGLIEVGWEAESSSEPEASTEPEPEPVAEAGPLAAADREPRRKPLGVDEPIDDPYATLQAWSEWATNQGRGPMDVPSGRPGRSALSPVQADPDLRAEGPQEFAPYSQLFSRLRETRRDD
jgi:general secretion pathway protein A